METIRYGSLHWQVFSTICEPVNLYLMDSLFRESLFIRQQTYFNSQFSSNFTKHNLIISTGTVLMVVTVVYLQCDLLIAC